jgi:hypothetical protein
MFRRVIIEDWHQYLPMIGFALTFGVFLFMLLRALLMRREKCHALAHLPLEEEAAPENAEPTKAPCDGQCRQCRCTRDASKNPVPVPKSDQP